MADDDKHPLDAAYERYTDGKIMRRDMIRLLIDAVKDAEARLSTLSVQAALAPTVVAKRGGWPKGKPRKPQGQINGHTLDTIPVGGES